MKRHFKNLVLGLIVVAMIFGSGFDSLATVLNEPENPGNIEVNKSAEATEECREFEVTLEITGTPPAKPVDVVLVIDTSGSMSTDGRIGAAKTAAKSFADVVLGDGNPNNNRISVVNYSTRANHTKDWTNDLSAVKSSINNLSTSGYTNIHEGFIFAENRIDAAITARPESTKVIVMMSDGGANRWMDGSTVKYTTNYPTSHNNSTNAAWQKGQALQSKANIFTIGLFTGMPSNQYLIAKDTLVKSAPSGQFYDSPTTAELEGIYTSIAGLINYSAKDAEVILD